MKQLDDLTLAQKLRDEERKRLRESDDDGY